MQTLTFSRQDAFLTSKKNFFSGFIDKSNSYADNKAKGITVPVLSFFQNLVEMMFQERERMFE